MNLRDGPSGTGFQACITSSVLSSSVTSSMRPLGSLLERFAADEIVIELDVGTVAEVPRRQVVVLDVR